MSCRIEEISIQNLGPLTKFNFKPGLFSLIYGHNEKGKTFLVEFLIRSLFKNAARWNLRPGHGRGRIRLLSQDGRSHNYSPGSTNKLEDLWENDAGLPTDFSRLLVVKGAELEFNQSEGGIDKTVLKELLAGYGILDDITKKISKILQKAEICVNTIRGTKKGEIEARERLMDHVRTLGQLFDQIDKGYSGAQRKMLTDEKQSLEERIQALRDAKHHHAFILNQEINDLEKEFNQIPEDRLRQTRETLSQYRMKIDEYKGKKKEQEETEKRCTHYDWLSGAHEFYQNYLEKEPAKQPWIFILLSFIFIIGAAVLNYLSKPMIATIALGTALVCIILFFMSTRIKARRSAEDREVKKLEKEFMNRFNEPLTGLPILRERLFQMEEDYSKSRILKDQLYADLRQIENLKRKIGEGVLELYGEERQPEHWQKTLDDLNNKRRDLGNRIQGKKEQLARLNVDTSDYQSEDPGIPYSDEMYEFQQENLKSVSRRLGEYEQKLDTLKQRICQETSDSINTPWESLIQNLREIREQAIAEYKRKTAEILGKIIVHRILQDFRSDEDTKLVEGLHSEEVLQSIKALTHRYDKLSLNGDQIVVSDAYDDFVLSELSTGAREQILLALRIGFAQKLTQQDDPLFLILDDAFQYSDWERREWLMDAVVQLAKSGWQILYFTMDDHIKKLFEKKGKTFGNECRIVELN